MNLKAIAGAIRSPKTPLRLKEGLLKKYGKQLKKEFSKDLPEVLSNPKEKTYRKIAFSIGSQPTILVTDAKTVTEFKKRYLKEYPSVRSKDIKHMRWLDNENPPKGAVKIYDNLEAIEAQKGKNSCWPKEHFRHDFKDKSSAAVYGLPDGSLLIKGEKPLWKNFNYPGKKRK